MPHTIDIDTEQQLLRSVFTGPIDRETVEAFTSDALKALQEHGVARMITDFRAANMKLSCREIIELPTRLKKSGLSRTVRRALVVRKITEEFRFYEDVSQNQVFTVRVFTDYDKALSWVLNELPGFQHPPSEK